MFRKTSLALAAVAALSLLLAVRPASAAQPDISGTYQCSGSNPDGSRYSGTVTITRKGDMWRVDWTIAGKTHAGVGLIEGSVFSACWNIVGTRDGGIVVYRIEAGGRLAGEWATTTGSGDTGTETLTRRLARR